MSGRIRRHESLVQHGLTIAHAAERLRVTTAAGNFLADMGLVFVSLNIWHLGETAVMICYENVMICYELL